MHPIAALRETLSSTRDATRARLARLRFAVRRELLLEGLAWLLGGVCLLAGLSLLLDWLLRLERPWRFGLLAVFVAGLLLLAIRRLARPLAVPLSEMDLAVLLDRRRPGAAQAVANVLQLPLLLGDRSGVSHAMIRVAVERGDETVRALDFAAALDARRRLRHAAILGAAFALPLALTLFYPGVAGIWARRWFRGSNERWPQKTHLELLGYRGGPIVVPRDEPMLLRVQARSGSRVPRLVHIRYRTGGRSVQDSFSRYGTNDFRYDLPPVHDPLELRISGGDDWLDPIAVKPIDRPRLEDLQLAAHLPGRPSEPPRSVLDASGDLVYLRRTEVHMRLKATEPLAAASLTSNTGKRLELKPLDERTYEARWSMLEPLALEIQLTGRAGGLVSRPYSLSIGILKDREPRVTLRSQGVGPRITPQAHVPLTLAALDDFGVIGLSLSVQRAVPADESGKAPPEQASQVVFPPPARPETRLEQETRLNLKDYLATAGMQLRLRGSARDNCAEGPQTGHSSWLTFRVVAPEQLLHEILVRQRLQRARFQTAVLQARGQRDALAAQSPGQSVEGLIRKHRAIDREVAQVGDRLADTMTELELNELSTQQGLTLLREQVVNPLRKLHTTTLARLAVVLEQRPAAPSPEALAEAQTLQAEALQQMERILKQMSQWESFVDVVNQLKEVMRLQGRVLETTEGMKKKRIESIFEDK